MIEYEESFTRLTRADIACEGTARMITNDLQNRIHFGDREAFLAVYQEYGPGAYSAANQALASDALAASAIKQVFLTLYEEILTQSEDFDIPVRIRELTEHEIKLLRLVSGKQSFPDRLSAFTSDDAPDPEGFSARGAFLEHADRLPNLPSLDRDRSFRKPRKGLFLRRRQPRGAGVPLVWKILLVLVDLFLLWVLVGLLMALGYLPAVDLGYVWFSRVFSTITLRLT